MTDLGIVVAVDGSPASRAAVKWAAVAADKRGENLHLAASYTVPQFLYAEGMVPPEELFSELLDEAKSKVSQAKDMAKKIAPGVTIDEEVELGSPIDMLLGLSSKAAMIVMGSRGLGGLSGMVMGSVSAAVVSHAHCPVVVVREDSVVDETTKDGPVVVGVDGSGVSQKATEYAFAEAHARHATLVAVHTWMDVQVQASLAGLATAERSWDDIESEQVKELDSRLEAMRERYPDVEVKKVITRDRPVRALVDAAQGAQLLVVGSHGRGGFKGMLLGSTSRALLQSAPCPMMVVRHDSKSHPDA